ncbi:MAG: hypothetical protein CL858_03795 [Cupriavidus sp.]|nr:hypothetical protein [Cupriavidus sp.]
MTISFRIVKNSEPISLAEGSFAFMRLVLQQPAKPVDCWPQLIAVLLEIPSVNRLGLRCRCSNYFPETIPTFSVA